MSDVDVERQLEHMHTASFGWALTCCRFDRDEATEALQIAYLRVLEGRARFDGLSSCKTWFFGVVRRAATEQRRTRLIRRLAFERWVSRRPATQDVPTPERLAHAARLRGELNVALGRLSARQREVLHLVFYQELTLEEAADVLGLSVGSVRTHYARGKARLRELLGATGDTPWTHETIASNG